LRAPGGEKIGTLCLVDSRPREFTEAQLALLQKLGGLVERELRISELMHAQTGMLAAQAELLKTRERLQSELQEAARYLRSLLPAPMAEPIKVDWRFVPSDELGGDCLGYQTLPGGQLAFYIVDVCGHGVGAAMLSVALLNILRSQSLADVEFSDPASVLSALNRSFQMSDHGSKFFTIWYGVLTPATGELVYSSGGHPPAIQVRSFGGSSRLNSNGIAVGCVTWAQYQNMKGRLEPGDALFVFSDGAYEVPVKEREILGLDGFEKLLLEIAETPEKRLERLGSRVSEMAGRQRFSDDVSILMLQMPASPKS